MFWGSRNILEHTNKKHNVKNSSIVFLLFGRPPPPFIVKDYENGPFFFAALPYHERLQRFYLILFIMFAFKYQDIDGRPRWVGGGGEEEEGPGGDDDEHGGDVVQEDIPLPSVKKM